MSRLYQQRVRMQQMCLCVCVCERERKTSLGFIVSMTILFFPPNKSYVVVKTCFGGYSQKKQHLLLFFGWGWAVLGINLQRFSSSLCSVHSVKSVEKAYHVTQVCKRSVISFQCATVRNSTPFIVPCSECYKHRPPEKGDSFISSKLNCLQLIAGSWYSYLIAKESLVIRTSVERLLFIPCL